MSGPADASAALGRWDRRMWAWAALAPVAALVAFRDAFRPDRVYYVRDLASQFWGEHLWLRHELFEGRFPLWDPYVAFGQPAISDPNRGLLFPPTLLLRLVPSTTLGFNLCVALPFPVLALGMFLFLRRQIAPAAAAFGAAAFVLSGPALSMANFLNVPWAFAFLPWALYAADLLVERPTRWRFAALAAVFALLFLAGESATLLSSSLLTVAYAAVGSPQGGAPARRARLALLVGGAGFVSLLLVAVQALPLAETIGMSLRAVGSNQRIVRLWSLHPLSLVEALSPQAFGDPIVPLGPGGSWTTALNSGREPLLFSIYVGAGTLGLALLGALVPRSRRAAIFWGSVALVTLVFALGDYAGLYPALQRLLPVLGSVRYPVKYAITTAFAVAVLAAFGWDTLVGGRERPGFRRGVAVATGGLAAAGLLALGVALWGAVAPWSLAAAVASLAAAVGADPSTAPDMARSTALVLAPRLVALASGMAVCLWLGAAPERRGLRGLMFGLVLCDLLLASANLVPTVDAALLGRPDWVSAVREHPEARVYVAGRLSSTPNTGAKPDMPFLDGAMPVTENPPAADRAALLVFLDSFPGARQVRDSISYDNSLLFPREFWDVVIRFRDLSLDERARFLRRVGVRYFLVPWEEWPDGVVLMEFPDRAPLRLYEREPEVPRASVVLAARVEPDAGRQLDCLFDASFDPAAEVVVATEPPAAAGAPAAPCGPAAEIVEDGAEVVAVRACAPERGGYLLLLDSFDPNWHAEVDGADAAVVRADGLFRAVRLAPGSHDVRFSYRPRRLWIGAVISVVTAVCLIAACVIGRRRLE